MKKVREEMATWQRRGPINDVVEKEIIIDAADAVDAGYRSASSPRRIIQQQKNNPSPSHPLPPPTAHLKMLGMLGMLGMSKTRKKRP